MKRCVNKAVVWEYKESPPLNQTMLLLTTTNKCVIGVWKGEPPGCGNRNYKAWSGLPDRDQNLERDLGHMQ